MFMELEEHSGGLKDLTLMNSKEVLYREEEFLTKIREVCRALYSI
jgi:hypothetical protein